jgi:hypothetical protein
MARIEIPGVKINLRGQEFVLPPLTIAAYEQYREKIEALDKGESKQTMLDIAEVLLAALTENYPDLTLEDLKRKHLDMHNATVAYNALWRQTVEGVDQGEAKAP